MQIFIDSVDLKEIEELNSYGIIDGVTTNPSLFAKAGRDFYETSKEICQIVDGPVSIEAISSNYDDILKEGEKIFSIAENVVLKLPITPNGLKACNYFAREGYPVNMTLCFSVNQALLAAKAGATYVSPFIGRVEDAGDDGIKLISDITTMTSHYIDLEIMVLAASIRTIEHVYKVAMIGVDSATISPNIIRELIKHPLTDRGLEIFDQDWKKSGLKI